MRRPHLIPLAATAALIGLANFAWPAIASATPSGSTATTCPTTPVSALMPAGPGAGAPAVPPQIIIAKTVKPSDVRTSVVIAPNPKDQIRCGKTALKTDPDIVFSTPVLGNGTAKPLSLDIQRPAAAGRKPLVIFITGGGFMIAPKENNLDLRTFVAESGFVVASVQYRTILDGAGYKDSLADVKSAIRFLRAHAETYGIDPDHVAVWGQSAGGYLAAMAGVTSGVKGFDIGENLNQSSKVEAVVDEFGSSDMTKVAADFDVGAQKAYDALDNPMVRFFDGPAGGTGLLESPTASGAANPLTYVSGSTPPFLLFHGDADKIISPSQTLMLHEQLRAAGVKSTRYVLKGAGHGDLSFVGDAKAGLPWSTNQVMGLITGFLHRTLSARN